MTRVTENDLSGIVVKVADTVPDLLASARLVHDMYVARGLIEPKPSGMRATPHLLLPSTATFIAQRGEEIIGTLSLVVDSQLGLPMEKAFPAEVQAVRAAGRKTAEVGALCVTDRFRSRGVSYLLNKLMWRCAREVYGIDDLLISVVPPADALYRAALLFRPLGAKRRHPSVKNGVVTIPMTLDLRTAPEIYRSTFGEEPSGDNPYHRYCLLAEPQLQMPAPASLLQATEARREAAARLANACATGLDALDVSQLRKLVEAAGLDPSNLPLRSVAVGTAGAK